MSISEPEYNRIPATVVGFDLKRGQHFLVSSYARLGRLCVNSRTLSQMIMRTERKALYIPRKTYLNDMVLRYRELCLFPADQINEN